MGLIYVVTLKDVVEEIEGVTNELPSRFKSLIDGLKEDYGFHISVYVPVGETGNLAANHVVVDTGDYDFFYDNEMMYYPFVILGTRPHPIDPLMPAYALYWPGAAHPVRHVDHPGTAPYDYMGMAFDSAEPEVDQRIDEIGSWIVFEE
jgi:hypothetical protein